MGWLSLSQVAAMSEGTLSGADARVASVTIDSRQVAAEQLFIALQGTRFDAHEFIDDRLPAAGVLVSRPVETALPQVRVADTTKGLTRLAAAWRARLALPIIALTGSNGKTTVKEMIASILGVTGSVLATQGNLNNHLGVPLTLLAIRAWHDFAVIEMGANHAGEIAALTALTGPDIALITNAGAAHLEGFGDLDGVARAKGEILDGLPAAGIAVINADDPFADYWLARAGRRHTVTFGLARPASVRGGFGGGGSLHISMPAGECDLQLPLVGRHNALNALAATAVAHAAGIGLETITRGLAAVRPVGGRLIPQPGLGGCRILDDTYNANPGSLAAALEVLAMSGGQGWVVLGDMAELGQAAEAWHAEVGRLARERGIARLYALGPLSGEAVAAFGTGARHFEDTEALLSALLAEDLAGVEILVKGSRAMRMERVVEALRSPGHAA